MFHNVRFSFDMLELFMMDSIHTETKIEVYKNFRDKSVLRDTMITYENIVPKTQTGLSHTFTRGLHIFSGDFRWFLILIAQEVKIHRGSVPTALVYCSGFNLSSAKLYRQVNHSVGSFCNVRWFYDNLPNGFANWSVCWVFGVRIGGGEKTEPNCCLTSFQWAVISEDFLFTCPHNVILFNKNHKAIFTVGYAVNKVLLVNWVKTGVKRAVRIEAVSRRHYSRVDNVRCLAKHNCTLNNCNASVAWN